MLNPRQIEAFRLVVTEKGVSRAAAAMGVTQPAVSRLIREFEVSVGLSLFDRTGTRLRLTREGSELYREVENYFNGLNGIFQRALDIRGQREGTMRLAILPALTNSVFSKFLARFMGERPNSAISVYSMPSSQIIDAVASGQCDIGVGTVAFEHSNVTAHRLDSVQAVAVVPTQHKLAKKKGLIPSDFANQNFISIAPPTLLRLHIDAFFAHGVPRQLKIESQPLTVAVGLVAAGLGVSIVDPFSAAEYRGRGVVAIPIEPKIDIA